MEGLVRAPHSSVIVKGGPCWLNVTSGSSGGVVMTLNSELFVQSDRLAAFAITGSQRSVLFSVVGVTFPFLIVSTMSITDHNRLSAMLRCLNSNTRSCSWAIFISSSCPRKSWSRTAFWSSPVSAWLVAFIPSLSCRRPKGRPWWKSPMSFKQSPSVANPLKRGERRPNSERQIIQKNVVWGSLSWGKNIGWKWQQERQKEALIIISKSRATQEVTAK